MKKFFNVIYLLSIRFGLQEELVIQFPDNAKLSKKYRRVIKKLPDEAQRKHNWR